MKYSEDKILTRLANKVVRKNVPLNKLVYFIKRNTKKRVIATENDLDFHHYDVVYILLNKTNPVLSINCVAIELKLEESDSCDYD